MSFGDLIWLFFIFSAIQPMLQQKMLEAMRVRKISQLERERKSRVILLVHRQETMRFLGFPVARYIDINDSEEVLRAIQMTDADVPLDLVLHTPGGLVLAALQIAKAVREHKAARRVEDEVERHVDVRHLDGAQNVFGIVNVDVTRDWETE